MDFTKQTIKTSVVACIIDDRQRVLLTRRCIEPFCSQWVMPGGKIDHGEAILAALHREVREEVGLEIRAEGLIDVYEHLGVGSRQDHYVILYYRCTPLSFALKPNGDECTEALWASSQRLPEMALPPGCRYILAQVYPELGWGQIPKPEDVYDEIPDHYSGGRND
ncbi:NUDIX domain-containing protein [Geopsychrobacter electrodiphilus]|uniref:NUDIX domain-containing protein n=1 Tax=Geopsychrobacter electrodiphilus TaxID=225196 RepID=UPI000362E769|nr:NUDIX hydrolase [Geopsychrobacter electrodiphilus]